MKWAVNRLVGLLIAIAFLAALGTAQAQNATLGTSPGTSDWNTNTNWTPQTVPSGTATFGSSNTTSITFSANGGTGTIGEILFNAGAPAYSFSFSGAFQALTITGVGIVNNSSNISTFFNAAGGTLVFRNTSAAGNATIINNSHGFTRFFNTSTAGNAAITTNSGGFTLFSNASTGGSLVKVGSGTLVLSGTNTYTGGTTISAGTLQLGSGGASGSIPGNVVDNGVFAINRSDALTFGGVISGTGSFQQLGTGTTILTTANSYSGGTTISAGVLNVSADHNLGAASGGLTLNGGTLQFGSTFNLANTRTITLNGGGGTFDTDAFNTTISQRITGVGGLIKTGPGILTLSGSDSYSGGTVINAGILLVNNAQALGPGRNERIARLIHQCDSVIARQPYCIKCHLA
jgi:autotransporter-associated beta strand protein